ncbi:MAG: hypothetical protein ACKVQA_16140 [Burkholderiales bacterium]
MIDKLPWFIAKMLRRKFPEPWNMYCVLNWRPLVIMIPEDWTANPGLWQPFFEDLRHERVHFLLLVRGPIEVNPPSYTDELRGTASRHLSEFPRHTFTYLANNETQCIIFRKAGVPHALINQNGIADERTFAIEPTTPKDFDAVYNAVMLPFKRHHLAAKIRSLALITYLKSDDPAYFESVATGLAHASWLNFANNRPDIGTFRRLSREDVARQINRARVGLCLSAQEGAMFAAVEYLLCGLPVVTSESIGGRDAMFSSEYVVTVADHPEDVRAGVEDLVARKIDGAYIRAQTLDKMQPHRTALVDLITSLSGQDGIRLDPLELRSRLFPRHIYKLRPLHRVRQPH